MYVKHVCTLSRIALAPAVVCAAYMQLDRSTPLDQHLLFCGLSCFGLLLLAILAFPRHRRNDLCLMVAAVCLMLRCSRLLFGGSVGTNELLADAFGLAALYVPTYLEALRWRLRNEPWSPLINPPPFVTRSAYRPALAVLPVRAEQERAGVTMTPGRPLERSPSRN